MRTVDAASKIGSSGSSRNFKRGRTMSMSSSRRNFLRAGALTGLGSSLWNVAGPQSARAADAPRGANPAVTRPPAQRLHPRVIQSTEHRAIVSKKLQEIGEQRRKAAVRRASPGLRTSIEIPLTTVSLGSNFSASINIAFQGQGTLTPLEVDSGSSTLIVPHWEVIKDSYTDVLGYEIVEPFGCPARLMRGPIILPDALGGPYTIPDCVFYACTGPNKYNDRTHIFGAGCITPWAASGWNTPGDNVVLRAPQAYDEAYPFAEFHYAPAATIFAACDQPTVVGGSRLTLHQCEPPGYTMFEILWSFGWMSLTPTQLWVNGVPTNWAQDAPHKVALIDNGGGPVLFSDPGHHVCNGGCPQPATCDPCGTDLSQGPGMKGCQCSRAPIAFCLTDACGCKTYSFTIDASRLPETVRGLTFLVCDVNTYIPTGYQGMNIGGISMLFNDLLIDYRAARVGFKPSLT
jgi:hypothetical protein